MNYVDRNATLLLALLDFAAGRDNPRANKRGWKAYDKRPANDGREDSVRVLLLHVSSAPLSIASARRRAVSKVLFVYATHFAAASVGG